MTRRQLERPDLRAESVGETPASFGRGTGCTIKELRAAVNRFALAHGVGKVSWRRKFLSPHHDHEE